MNHFLIQTFINQLRIIDIKNYAQQENIILNDEEANIIFYYLKNHWQILLYGNPKDLFTELKKKIDYSLYKKIEALYFKFKPQIN